MRTHACKNPSDGEPEGKINKFKKPIQDHFSAVGTWYPIKHFVLLLGFFFRVAIPRLSFHCIVLFLCSWLNTSGFSMFLRDLQLILSYWCFKLNSEALCNLDFVCILFKIN